MIVTETGATSTRRGSSRHRRGASHDVPRIKAVVYFDAVGDVDWRLSSYGGVGLHAFAELGHNPGSP